MAISIVMAIAETTPQSEIELESRREILSRGDLAAPL